MAWWRSRILTPKANIYELRRAKCKAEQCIRTIELTVAMGRAEAQNTESTAAKHTLREHLVEFKRCPLADYWLAHYCRLT